jgi:hypothetical protein
LGRRAKNLKSLERLVEEGCFGSEMDAAKFAMAYAINKGVTLGPLERAETKWNVGSFDPNGSIKALIETLYPEEAQPCRVLEFMLNRGLDLLHPDVMTSVDVAGIINEGAQANALR